MMANCKEDRQWCGKKMEGGEGLKTLECLRARLLAERQASRSAKEEAELMGKKLIELENQIKKETALRNKAEKRLKLLVKKLESLNATSTSVASENSTSCETTSYSSTTKETEERELKSENLVSTIPENLGEKVPEITASKQGKDNLSAEGNNHQNALDQADSSPNASPKVKSPKSSCTDPHQTSQMSQSKDQSFSEKANERGHEHYQENLLALVPAAATSPAANSATREMKLKPAHEKRVSDVLDALKHIRENSRSSFQRRHNMEAIMSM